MGYIEDELRKLIIKRYGSLKSFSDITKIPYTTLASIFQRGISNAKVTNITKITDELDIDTNQLGSGKIAPIYHSEPSREKQKEILGLGDTSNTIAAHFDGDKFTDEELEQIRQFAEFVKSKRKDNTNTADHLQVNAAHARTDVDIPEGADTSDDDIMNDDNF